MAETTALESLKRFCFAVVDSLGDEYLRAPTTQYLSRLLRIGEERGFPGMLGSLNCMHWRWKNCPETSWAGQFTGKEKALTIVLEAVADYEAWMWHLFFGMPGSHNHINVLDRSHLFTDLTDGRAPSVSY
uniref:F21J9.3 putative n=1 Tax=Albugo laibachii Nc14 TaxID=890382 RepID=F0WWK0_9STRA|nr:F21J9.3 putative [Albugo laibachii Nc14]|eukprot:CCA25823.1 F21J9.3 putative [Albugo laibachii Nc14]